MLHGRLGHSKLKWLAQEHQVLRDWRRSLDSSSAKTHHILVAVSGGVDSIVLLHLLQRLKPVLKIEISVVHIHHGPGGTQTQVRYREKALKFVRAAAEQMDLPFYSAKSQKALKSEAEFREFRYEEIARILKTIEKRQKRQPLVALAHHRDDLLETQMLRLIRGTGVEGLRAMSFYSASNGRLRPLIGLSQTEVLAYAKKLKLKWLEDPSNKNLDPLRNWLRQQWLPSLEKKSPGSRSSLARSLSQISETLTNDTIAVTSQNGTAKDGFLRADFLAQSRDAQRTTVVRYLKKLGIHQYTQGQIEEICRRLDNTQKEYTFNILEHVWVIDTLRIKAQRA